MVVSQQDWISSLHLSFWGRISLFLVVGIVIIVTLVSLQEYLSLNGIEAFVGSGNGNKNSSFPLRMIVPQEYIRPELTEEEIKNHTITIRSSINTRNRFVQSIVKSNTKLPLLFAKTETTALEDVERRESSVTICSAISLHHYRKQNPESKIAVIDIVDNLSAQIIVPSTSKIFNLKDLHKKVISCGLPGSASHYCMKAIAESYGWAQNRDYVIQEQVPEAVQLRHNMLGRIPQVDAVIVVDTFPSPVINDMIGDEAHKWRFIPVDVAPTKQWNLNEEQLSKFNQEGNYNKINTIITPMVMVANTTYPSTELLTFATHMKNPIMYYNLQQVVDMYKLPLHPTSSKIYSNLGLLG